MSNKKYILLIALIAMTAASCMRSSDSPGREYIPDMARDVAFEGYYENPGDFHLPNRMNAQLPPEGSISQSTSIYPFPNTTEGYEAAGLAYTNEFTFTEDEITGDGKYLFEIFCAVCHGEAGDGNGHLVQIEKFPPPPSYFRDDILILPEGKRYHTVMYGKGLMGSYATQINHRERWLILKYVEHLQNEYKAKNAPKEPTEAS